MQRRHRIAGDTGCDEFKNYSKQAHDHDYHDLKNLSVNDYEDKQKFNLPLEQDIHETHEPHYLRSRIQKITVHECEGFIASNETMQRCLRAGMNKTILIKALIWLPMEAIYRVLDKSREPEIKNPSKYVNGAFKKEVWRLHTTEWKDLPRIYGRSF